MKNKLFAVLATISVVLLLSSCSKDDSNPISLNKQYDWEGEIGKINYAYEDSILFTSARCEGTPYAPNIYIMNKDGNGIRPLTKNYFTFGASYSPRRWKILFIADTSYITSSRVLYMMDVDGKNQKIISKPGEDVWAAACSPDGNMIAYIILNSGKGKIRVLNMKDSSLTDITGWYGFHSFKNISWSTDSKKIVFDGMPGDKIGIANADGSGYSELFPSNLGCYTPRWSKDGKYIVYSSNAIIDSNYYSNIFIYDLQNKVSKQITNIKGFSYDPCWSIDNKDIIFASRENDNNSPSFLYKINIASKQITLLTNGTGGDWSPYW
jgi:Tol biopolymer transport system component